MGGPDRHYLFGTSVMGNRVHRLLLSSTLCDMCTVVVVVLLVFLFHILFQERSAAAHPRARPISWVTPASAIWPTRV